MSQDRSPALESPAVPLPSPRRRVWLTVLLALCLFAAGTVCGAAVTVLVAVGHIQRAIMNPELAPAHIANRLQGRLGLSAAQRVQVEQILIRHQQALQEIRREVQPRVGAELMAVRTDIDSILTPSQREKWDGLFDRLRHNWWPPLPPDPHPTPEPRDSRP